MTATVTGRPCPRCGRPEHGLFGNRLAAVSRKARVRVCSSCGNDERALIGRAQDPWPTYPNEISGERN